MDYGETYLKLTHEAATIVFIKANGDVRVMLATRNESIASLIHGDVHGILNGHDKRCSINNGTMEVIDLIMGEARSFNIGRVVSLEYHGDIKTIEQYEKVYAEFKQFKEVYEQTNPQKLSMELLSD